MGGRRKMAAWVIAAIVVGVFLATLLLMHLHRNNKSISLRGAVIRLDPDVERQLPIADVEIAEVNGMSVKKCKSDSSGYFSLSLRPGIKTGQSIGLRFQHPDYQLLDLNEVAGDKLYLARLVPIPSQRQVQLNRPEIVVSNVSARYSIKTTTAVNVGSAVRAFAVTNTNNVPCNGQDPCSPDGKWKAGVGSVSLDAGQGNEFRNTRVSCIAGPCPFTKIESDSFSRRGRRIDVSARNWSDTAIFLLEAEVFHPMVSDSVRKSYPVIFGQALNFTLPAAAEGVCIEAELNGEPLVFPLGPSLFLSWADCNARVNSDQTKVYRCEPKPGYRFP